MLGINLVVHEVGKSFMRIAHLVCQRHLCRYWFIERTFAFALPTELDVFQDRTLIHIHIAIQRILRNHRREQSRPPRPIRHR